MTPEQTTLVERLRALLAGEPSLREVSMFGSRSIMVNDALLVSALKDGGLLVRVDSDRQGELLGRPGAEQAQMGPGRDMGPGWIAVDATAISDEDGLSSWLDLAMERNRRATRGR